MAKTVVIIGAGVIGSALAFRLQGAGCTVTVIDAGQSSATDASFGWINASFYLSEDHFRLRAAGIEAYTRLASDLALPLRTTGCLNWEYQGAAQVAFQTRLAALNYPVERIDAAQFSALEPAIANPPDHSLHFRTEAVAEPGALRRTLLVAAQAKGARMLSGVRVLGIGAGVDTTAGHLAADDVVVAAGTGSAALLTGAGYTLPMRHRPAYVVETAPLPPVLSHVLAGPNGEVRQRSDGVLVAPAAVSHQSDAGDGLDSSAQEAAEATIARLQPMLPNHPLSWSKVTLAHRPVPGDDLPVIGRLAGGPYVACMHSGITLGAITADLAATEILSGPSNTTEAQLSAFRPDRLVPK